MKLPNLEDITTPIIAQQIAIEWQHWFSENSISYGELSAYQHYFTILAERFGLTDEFKENGII